MIVLYLCLINFSYIQAAIQEIFIFIICIGIKVYHLFFLLLWSAFLSKNILDIHSQSWLESDLLELFQQMLVIVIIYKPRFQEHGILFIDGPLIRVCLWNLIEKNTMECCLYLLIEQHICTSGLLPFRATEALVF